MALNQSTARWIAPLAFTIDLAAQVYGLVSTPNMKDIHDAHLSFFSPQPLFVAGLFFPLQIVQLVWLYRLYTLDSAKGPAEKKELAPILDYVPFYVLGNLCLAIWMLFWNAAALKTANVFVLINSLAQLYYVFGRLPAMNTASRSSILTHVIAKGFAGLGVLDVLHNGSIAYFEGEAPTTLVKVATGIVFSGLASVSDWMFGACLVYDLVAMGVGQRIYTGVGWSNLLFGFAGSTGVIVGVRNWLRPPYVRMETMMEGYQPVEDNL